MQDGRRISGEESLLTTLKKKKKMVARFVTTPRGVGKHEAVDRKYRLWFLSLMSTDDTVSATWPLYVITVLQSVACRWCGLKKKKKRKARVMFR